MSEIDWDGELEIVVRGTCSVRFSRVEKVGGVSHEGFQMVTAFDSYGAGIESWHAHPNGDLSAPHYLVVRNKPRRVKATVYLHRDFYEVVVPSSSAAPHPKCKGPCAKVEIDVPEGHGL